jgi:transposase-like protein
MRSVDREWLQAQLEQGRSVEAIARELGRDPSTISYWMRKHGLHSAHAERHAARGGLERDELAVLVAQGLSIRQLAERLDRSPGTVRHWLRRYGLRTVPTKREALDVATDGLEMLRECPRHGVTAHRQRANGAWRCLRCRSRHVTEHRRRTKARMLSEAGGRCVLCGYDRCPSALHFHHLEPERKRFGLATAGATRALATTRAEVAKCVLLCANCHAEVEAGLAMLPRSDGFPASPNPG